MKIGQRVLVVDADAALRARLAEYLPRFRYSVETLADGAAMPAQLAQSVDLVVLDVALPGRSGLSLAQSLRCPEPGLPRVPFILTSAHADATDRVIGLELGADDYLSKPYEPRELVARIHTVLRRVHAAAVPAPAAGDSVRFDGWELQRHERRLISPQGRPVALSNAEFRLLSIFLKTPRRVVSRDELMAQSRDREMERFERSIDLLVSRLRQKLAAGREDAASLIRTVRGEGYAFDACLVQGDGPRGG